jgi:outer membrane protein TolC
VGNLVKFLNLFVVLLAGLLHGACIAEESPTPTPRAPSACKLSLSLDEFRAYGLKESPLIAEIDRDYALQVARSFDAELLSNPEVTVEQTYTRMAIGGANDSQSYVSFGQPIRISQLGARQRFADLVRKAGDLEKKLKLLEFQQKLFAQSHSLLFLQEAQVALSDAAGLAADGLTQVKRAVAQGLLSEGDEALFEGELFRLQAQVMGLRAQMESLQRELSLALGTPCSVVAAAALEVPPVPEVGALITAASHSDVSEAARLGMLEEVAREQERVARLDRLPIITPRVIYQHTNDGGDFIGGGISLPLPVWNRNQGERAKTSAEVTALQRRQQFLQGGGLQGLLTTTRSAAAYAQTQATLYATKVVPAFQRAYRAQERLYRQGKGTVLEVWQTLRAYTDAQEQALGLKVQALSERSKLSILVGEEV